MPVHYIAIFICDIEVKVRMRIYKSNLCHQTAYLKTHYPAEFMAAVISNQGGYYSPLAYISECRRMKLQVLMPDVNESRLEYIGIDNRVRVGLMQLKSFTTEASNRSRRSRAYW